MRAKITLFVFLILTSIIYAQDYPEKFSENQKYGIMYKGKGIFPAVYDYVSTNFVIITKKGKEINIYNLDNFQPLYSNIKAFEFCTSPDPYTVQIITKENELKTYNNEGIVNDYSIFVAEEKSRKEFFKKSIKEDHDYNIMNSNIIGIRYLKKDTTPYGFDYKLPKGTSKSLFLNNNNKNLHITNFYSELSDSFELEYSEEILFTPLKYSYVMAKVKGKYGVWDFKEEKIILPFEYKRIISYQKYLRLEKNELVTFYPNIGTEPKYKKLEPYIGAYARFETPDGKKGWVDRKGKEYFDE